MATGYDARQPGRQTFAQQGVAPVQTTTGASGESARAQVVGGESIGGVEGGQYSRPGYAAAGLGQFFERAMAPQIERKQKEQFFKGFTAAQSGVAVKGIVEGGGALSKVFGPSGYAQGAQFYASQKAVSDWTTSQLADMDNLKLLPPEELSKHMATSYDQFMTGDPGTDAIVGQSLLEAQGSVIQAVAKERFKYGQETVIRDQGQFARSSGTEFQQLMLAQAKLGDNWDRGAVDRQRGRYLSGLAKPAGMTDDSYEKFLKNSYRSAMQDGNFYAVESLRNAGILDVLPEEDRMKLDEQYDKYGKMAQDKVMQSPEFANKLAEFRARQAQNDMTGGDQMSAMDSHAFLRQMNQDISRASGVDRDYFDAEDMDAATRDVTGAIVSRFNRDQSKADAASAAAVTQQSKELEAAQKLASIGTVWATGNVTQAIALSGGTMTNADFDAAAMADFSRGDITAITRAFSQGNWSSGPVKTQVQGFSQQGLGQEWNKSAEQGYKVWQQFNKANPAMSREYFGDYDLAWTKFQRMSGTMGPEAAFRSAFASLQQYNRIRIPAERINGYAKAKTAFIEQQQPWMFMGEKMTDTAKGVLSKALDGEFSILSENSGAPTPELLKQAYDSHIANGTLEHYGALVWENGAPTQSLGSVLKLPSQDAAKVIGSVFRDELKAVGKGDLEGVTVIHTPNRYVAQWRDAEGLVHHTPIPVVKFKNRASWYVNYQKNHRPTGYTPPPTTLPIGL